MPLNLLPALFRFGKRISPNFSDLISSKLKPIFFDSSPTLAARNANERGPHFGEVVTERKARRFPSLAHTTRVLYEGTLKAHLQSFFEIPIRDITPKRIDEWLDDKKEKARSLKRTLRKSFDHEISLLATVLGYYQSYYDDRFFQYPIKKRHHQASSLDGKNYQQAPKDLKETEFRSFLEALALRRNGALLVKLATVQYYQAHRISESTGIFWEDIYFDKEDPSRSRLRITRSVCYVRSPGVEPYVKQGFKNAAVNHGEKNQPMFRETYEALKELWQEGRTGLVFSIAGKPLDYRMIQSSYNKAFQRAGLPYSGTHVMRHGGCRRIFNRFPDPTIAQQLLGNADLQSTLIYAKRDASALTKIAVQQWNEGGDSGTVQK